MQMHHQQKELCHEKIRIEQGTAGQVSGVQRSGGWGSTNPVTPPQPDWEHKHDKATLSREPDQVLEDNNRWRPKNVFTARETEGKRKMIKMEDSERGSE